MAIKSVYDLKPAFQNLLRPICRRLASFGVTANQVTVAAVVLSGAYGFWMIQRPQLRWLWIGLSGVLFVRMALNAIDGMLAREFNQRSKLGGYLNEVGDVVSDAFLYLPFAALEQVSAGLILVLVWLAALIEFCGVLALAAEQPRNYAGPFGKSDRAFLFGAFGIALFFGVSSTIADWVLRIFVALAIWTCMNRVLQGLGPAASESQPPDAAPPCPAPNDSSDSTNGSNEGPSDA